MRFRLLRSLSRVPRTHTNISLQIIFDVQHYATLAVLPHHKQIHDPCIDLTFVCMDTSLAQYNNTSQGNS